MCRDGGLLLLPYSFVCMFDCGDVGSFLILFPLFIFLEVDLYVGL